MDSHATLLHCRFAILLLLVCVAEAAANENSEWLKITTDNFTLISELDEQASTNLLQQLEVFRVAVLAITNVDSDVASIPTIIYAFDGSASLAPYGFTSDIGGAFIPGIRRNTILIRSNRLGMETETILHEYVHFLVRNRSNTLYPIWFDEGFAEYLSGVNFEDEQFTIGVVPELRREWLERGQWMQLQKVLFPNDFYGMRGYEYGMFYAQAWAVVHYLVNRPDRSMQLSRDMADYLQQIQNGVERRKAFREAFGVSAKSLDREVRRYLRDGRFPTFTFSIDDLLPEFSVRIEDLEPHAAVLELAALAMMRGKDRLAESLLQNHTDAFLDDAHALSLLSRIAQQNGDHERALDQLQKAVSLAPEDPIIQTNLGDFWLTAAAGNDDDTAAESMLENARDAYRRAWALDKSLPETYFSYALTLEDDAEQQELRIDMLEEAEYLLPSHVGIRFRLLDAYMDSFEFDNAEALARSLLAWGRATPETIKTARDALRVIEEQKAPD